MRILPHLSFAVLVQVLTVTPTKAEEPRPDSRHPFLAGAYEWRFDPAAGPALLIFAAGSETAIGRYDLSSCLFCAGEDDNCDSDGVSEIAIPTQPEEPALAVVCHVGAHSQRLQILAPMQDAAMPVHIVTGSYFVTREHDLNGLRYEYDQSAGDGAFETKRGRWP